MKRVARTKRELFINILDMWLQNEIQVIGEFCCRDIAGEKEKARKERENPRPAACGKLDKPTGMCYNKLCIVI